MQKLMIGLLAVSAALFVFAAFTQGAGPGLEATAFQQPANEDRVSGTILRSNKDKSMLVVKENRSNIERTVFYGDSTKWTKDRQPADMKEFKDGSRVVCLGKLNEKGELTATRIDLQPE